MKQNFLFGIPFLALLGGCVDGDFGVDGGGVGPGPKVSGSGKVAGKDFSVSDFHGIEAGGIFDVRCKVGSAPSLHIDADDNILPLIEVQVENGTLRLQTKQGFSTKNGIVATVTVPSLDHLDLSGAAKGDVKGIRSGKFRLDVSGAGHFVGDGDVQTLDLGASGGSSVQFRTSSVKSIRAELSGGSNLSLSGGADCETVDLAVSGGSHADLAEIQARKAQVDANGAASVRLNVTESITGEASGAASIHYRGGAIASVQKSGVASVGQD